MIAPVVNDFMGVLPENPLSLLAKYKHKIPTMMGFTKHDGSLILTSIFNYYNNYYNYCKINIIFLVIADMMPMSILLNSQMSIYDVVQMGMVYINENSHLAQNLVLKIFFSDINLHPYEHIKAIPSYIDVSYCNNYCDIQLEFYF